jgi:DNA-binding NarL/FixJ family response regulator
MNILIVDDHTLFRKGLANLLKADARFSEVADVSDAPTALEWLNANPVDLVTIDISLERGSGLDLLAAIRQSHPEQRTVVLTMIHHQIVEQQARALGTADFITKDVAPAILCNRLAAAVTTTGRFRTALDSTEDPLEGLSARQLDVFRLMGRGLTTREIADLLMVSPKTVESHRLRLKTHLQVDNVSQIVALAARLFPEG